MTLTFAQLDEARGKLGLRSRGDVDRVLGGSTERMRQAVFSRIKSDPLFKRYAAFSAPGRIVRNTEPWHAMGERLAAALVCCLAGTHPNIRVVAGPDMPEWFTVAVATRLASELTETYLWRESADNDVAALTLPRHIISRDCLPHPMMFLSYETAYGADDGILFDWMYLEDAYDGFNVVAQANHEAEGFLELRVGSVRYGAQWPDDLVGPFGSYNDLILKRLAFINSPYTTVERHQLPRHIRRDLARAPAPLNAPEPVCNVVVLRKRAPSERSTDVSPSTRQWKHHWWVSGHFRAQWLPSQQSHKVIWIAPYVKGPLDKPAVKRVYVVER